MVPNGMSIYNEFYWLYGLKKWLFGQYLLRLLLLIFGYWQGDMASEEESKQRNDKASIRHRRRRASSAMTRHRMRRASSARTRHRRKTRRQTKIQSSGSVHCLALLTLLAIFHARFDAACSLPCLWNSKVGQGSDSKWRPVAASRNCLEVGLWTYVESTKRIELWYVQCKW